MLINLVVTVGVSLVTPAPPQDVFKYVVFDAGDAFEIDWAVEDGANSLREVRNTLGVSSQCGKCGIKAREIVRESLSEQSDNAEQLFYAVS